MFRFNKKVQSKDASPSPILARLAEGKEDSDGGLDAKAVTAATAATAFIPISAQYQESDPDFNPLGALPKEQGRGMMGRGLSFSAMHPKRVGAKHGRSGRSDPVAYNLEEDSGSDTDEKNKKARVGDESWAGFERARRASASSSSAEAAYLP
jgi:hypothetical protein